MEDIKEELPKETVEQRNFEELPKEEVSHTEKMQSNDEEKISIMKIDDKNCIDDIKTTSTKILNKI